MSIINAHPLLAAAGADGGYQISRSVRLRSSASAYFNRTPASAGDRQKFTISFWMKRGTIGTLDLFTGNNANGFLGGFRSDNTLYLYDAGAASGGMQIWSQRVFRDPSAWYHIVIAVDTTQATDSNRFKVYINGIQETISTWNVGAGASRYPSLNANFDWNNTNSHEIGYALNYGYFDGYFTEFNNVSGQQLDASSFGETNAITGVWQPKKYGGTYGTNGFYLPFSDNSGADSFGIGVDKSAEALNRVELGNTSVGYTILGTMTFASAGAAQVHLRDNNSSTAAADPAGLTTNTALGYDFGRAIKIRKIATLTAAASGTAVTSIFNIQYSDDNVTWTTVTGSATTHTFSAGLAQSNTTDIDDNGSHRYWRLRYLSGTTAGNFWIATLDMYVNNIGPNSWFPVNISTTAGATYDSMLDVPTLYADGGNGRGNYATLNALQDNATLVNGNLDATSLSSYSGRKATMQLPTTGKWYWETTVSNTSTTAGNWFIFGMVTNSFALTSAAVGAANAISFGDRNDSVSGVFNETTTVFSSASINFATNDILQCAYDADSGKFWFGKNNSWYDSSGTTTGNPATGSNQTLTASAKEWFPFFQGNNTSSVANLNFGQRPFSYTPPTGFKALNTQNLPTPTISNGASYMAATTYTGTGSALSVSNAVNGVSFQPDFVWTKPRSTAVGHTLFDSLRGVTKYLQSNTTGAEGTAATSLTAFNSDGFTVNSDTSTGANGVTYIGWQWNAGGSTVTNTSGSISAQVRANATAGFSVVTYTGNGTSGATVGHGLGVAPAMMIIKLRNSTENWPVYHKNQNASPANGCTYLSLTNAYAAFTGIFNNTVPTSSVFTLGNNAQTNGNTNTYVAYCFAAVAGYSAFGSYTGNGSTDGPFVYLGFRPRFVMIKRTDVAATWYIWNTSSNTFNVIDTALFPNLTNAESSNVAYYCDILSNGFKPRATNTDVNASGGTYIYAAFSEVGFKYALGR
jgi:hypothetical protein